MSSLGMGPPVLSRGHRPTEKPRSTLKRRQREVMNEQEEDSKKRRRQEESPPKEAPTSERGALASQSQTGPEGPIRERASGASQTKLNKTKLN